MMVGSKSALSGFSKQAHQVGVPVGSGTGRVLFAGETAMADRVELKQAAALRSTYSEAELLSLFTSFWKMLHVDTQPYIPDCFKKPRKETAFALVLLDRLNAAGEIPVLYKPKNPDPQALTLQYKPEIHWLPANKPLPNWIIDRVDQAVFAKYVPVGQVENPYLLNQQVKLLRQNAEKLDRTERFGEIYGGSSMNGMVARNLVFLRRSVDACREDGPGAPDDAQSPFLLRLEKALTRQADPHPNHALSMPQGEPLDSLKEGQPPPPGSLRQWVGLVKQVADCVHRPAAIVMQAATSKAGTPVCYIENDQPVIKWLKRGTRLDQPGMLPWWLSDILFVTRGSKPHGPTQQKLLGQLAQYFTPPNGPPAKMVVPGQPGLRLTRFSNRLYDAHMQGPVG